MKSLKKQLLRNLDSSGETLDLPGLERILGKWLKDAADGGQSLEDLAKAYLLYDLVQDFRLALDAAAEDADMDRYHRLARSLTAPLRKAIEEVDTSSSKFIENAGGFAISWLNSS